MARIRTVKPEFCDDEKLGSVSRDARLLFIGMWIYSDDFGVVKGNSRWLLNKIFPYDSTKISIFDGWLNELISIDVIRPFETNGEKYFYIKNFDAHQKIDKPSKTRNPEPPEEVILDEYSPSIRRGLAVGSSSHKGSSKGRESEGKGEDDARTKSLHGEFQNVLLTDQELEKLQERFGKEKTLALIERLSSGMASKGYKYSSHYATILNWEKREPLGKSPPGPGQPKSSSMDKTLSALDEARLLVEGNERQKALGGGDGL
ncbi:MAG: hypothetical protein C4542_07220 [Dehalococcoidia bacterium]|nr:MAG: hypothetical protein C4542_07220 [Dehalococcoidia bacterium]